MPYDGQSILVSGYNMYKSTNGGISWSTFTTPINGWWDVSWSTDCSIILGASTPPILSTDSGVTWTTLNNVGTSGAGSRGGCVSADGKYMGYCDYTYDQRGYVYVSSDTGKTWTRRAGPASWHYVKTSANGQIWAACVQYAYVWTSTDFGVTWIERTNSRAVNWHGLAMNADGTRIYANYWGSSIIQVSTDFGQTWRDISNVPGYTRWAIGTSFDGTKILTGDYSGGYLYISFNSGDDWLSITSQGSRNWYDIGVSGDGTKFIGPSNTGLYTSFTAGTAHVDLAVGNKYN
jgi:hypothetical protein